MLSRIDARLERLEKSVEGIGEVSATAPATIATVVDTVDSAIERLGNRGVDVDARLTGLLQLVEKLTAPDTIEALENGLETLRTLPQMVATIADVFDSAVARLHEAGIDVDERLQVVAQVAERLTAPEALAAVREL
ncbi:MAG: hypothetical protein KDB80_10505, partial [Planctomycetes bacterium]|nr:hypothetical protein [Planctomycetota bacterium]